MLERVSRLLSTDYEIVGAVSDGIAAVEAADRLQPDLLVFDISMPGMTGLEAAARLADRTPRAALVFLTVYEDQEFVDAARSAGALGYVLKRNILTDLLPAVRGALAGQATLQAPVLISTPPPQTQRRVSTR